MNWIRENKMLAGILGFMGAGVLGLGIWLYTTYAAYASASEEYGKTREDVTNLQRQKPTPNSANVEGKTDKVKDYQDKVQTLRDVLIGLQHLHDITPITETDFQAKLKAHINAMKQQAATARVTLPEGFAFSFDDYIANVPKTPETAAELNLHLDVIEKLVSVMVEAGVKQLDKLDRTKLPFEPGGAVAAAVLKPVAFNKNKAAKPTPATLKVDPVLDRYPITLSMTCDQAPFQIVLNRLADPNYPYFMVVRQVRVENAAQEAPLREAVKNELQTLRNAANNPAPVPPGGAPAVTSTGLSAVPAAPPDAVTVMGAEMLHVYLEVDFIRFREPAKEAKPSEIKK